jgi:uncharacterized protein VirK/YbjX
MIPHSLESSAAGAAVRLPSLEWPDARTMFASAFELGWERRAKYALRLALTRRERTSLLRECAATSFADRLFRARPRAFYPLMNHLLDRRFGAQARLRATLASLRVVCPSMGAPAQVERFLAEGLELGRLEDGTRIELSLNGVSFHEGLWQLALVAADGTRLYSLGFGLVDDKTLLIGNVQGPSQGDGLEHVRTLTHAAHGLRPPYLLLHVLRRLAAGWGVADLRGIDPEHHVKGRWNLRDSRLRFDYRAFWTDCGATRHAHGHWLLAPAAPQRPLEEIASKRRAMYRRRYAMLDVLDRGVDARLSPARA